MSGAGEIAGDGDRCRLYLISPTTLTPAEFAVTLDAALGAGDVAAFQLRLKDQPDSAVMAAANALMPICHRHDVAFILNDRPDLAAACGADGVHVGDEDPDYAEARAAVGDDAIVGVTCRDSVPMAIDAAEEGADYVAFGAFYPTGTKTGTVTADPDMLRWWDRMMLVPSVAIGGIRPENCAPLVEAGADFLAVSAGVWAHQEGPQAAVRAFNAQFG